MDETDRRMREVLLELAMTSNGSTAGFESSTSGGYYTDVILTAGPDFAPQLWLAREYDAATSDQRREQLLDRALDTLKKIRYSLGDPSKAETLDEIKARIVKDGEGMTALRCAQWARSSERIVRSAREEAGRETEYGRKPRNGRALTRPERLVAIAELIDEEGMTMRDAARALDLSYNTVRRALGRPA